MTITSTERVMRDCLPEQGTSRNHRDTKNHLHPSQAWNILALDGSNWQYVDLFEFQIDIEGIVVENIARRCGGFLRKLSLRGCQAVGDNALATFSQYCNNIEHLDLKYCKKISDRTSQSLSLHCHKLQYLDVSSCSAVTDISLHALAQGCPGLVHLDISWCDMVTSNGVRSLSEGCKKLQVSKRNNPQQTHFMAL